MSWIDIEEELQALDTDFEKLLSSFGPNTSRCSSTIVEHLRLRPGLEPKWILHFSPLTTLYPLLQSESLGGVSKDLARRATLGHLCLMVHSFIEDRYLDRQFDPTREEFLFSKNMLLKGMSIIREVSEFHMEFESTVEELMLRYASSQVEPLTVPGDPLTDAQVLENSSGRAAFGVVAVMGLAFTNTCEAVCKGVIRDAFDFLVTGLQWADDIEDWLSDLKTGDENLLLATLSAKGYRPYGGAMSEAEVGDALQQQEILSFAIEQARRWVAASLDLQRQLGCTQLCTLIERNFQPLNNAEQRFLAGV